MKNSNKKAIKVFIVFFVLMILATFISNISSEFTKATVTVQRMSTKSINHSVEAEGVIISDSNKLITVPEDLLVENIYVEKGQCVESKDVLFSVDSASIEKQINKYEKLLETSQTSADTTLTRAQDDYDEAVSDGEISVASAFEKYDNAVKEYEKYEISENCDYDQLASLKETVDSTKEVYDSAVKSQEQSLKEANRDLEDAKNNFEYDNIDEYNSKINELKAIKDNKYCVCSDTNGTVQEIFINNGESTHSGSAIMLALESGEKSVVIDVDKSMRDYLNEKDVVSVSGYNGENEYCTYDNQKIYKIYNSTINDSIGSSEENINSIKVEIKLKDCNLNVSSVVKIKIENNSDKYEYCVPINAVMQDNDDYFVYVVSKKNGFSGDEFTAKRVDIDIDDKDSQYAAIKNGEVLYEEDIICETDKVIENGTKIKVSNKE